MFKILTQITIIIHLLFIIFVVSGGFLSRGRIWLTTIHLLAVVWAIYVEISPGIICPLTDLENHLAQRAGMATYKDDFVTRYLVPVIYPENLTPNKQYLLGGFVLVVNLVVYGWRWKRDRSA